MTQEELGRLTVPGVLFWFRLARGNMAEWRSAKASGVSSPTFSAEAPARPHVFHPLGSRLHSTGHGEDEVGAFVKSRVRDQANTNTAAFRVPMAFQQRTPSRFLFTADHIHLQACPVDPVPCLEKLDRTATSITPDRFDVKNGGIRFDFKYSRKHSASAHDLQRSPT